jgi:hypothetical protein
VVRREWPGSLTGFTGKINLKRSSTKRQSGQVGEQVRCPARQLSRYSLLVATKVDPAEAYNFSVELAGSENVVSEIEAADTLAARSEHDPALASESGNVIAVLFSSYLHASIRPQRPVIGNDGQHDEIGNRACKLPGGRAVRVALYVDRKVCIAGRRQGMRRGYKRAGRTTNNVDNWIGTVASSSSWQKCDAGNRQQCCEREVTFKECFHNRLCRGDGDRAW